MDKLLDDIEHKRSKRNEKSKRQRFITIIFYIISKTISIKKQIPRFPYLSTRLRRVDSHTLTNFYNGYDSQLMNHNL